MTLVSRSGSGPKDSNISLVSADAADANQMADLARGSQAIFNCVNPAYSKWVTDWPPIASSLLNAAKHSDAVLATCSNLYGYGPVASPITDNLPLSTSGTKGRVRAQMWSDALAAFERGEARIVEVRGSDYLGAGANAHLGERVTSKLRSGKTVTVVGSPDQPHSWTFTSDMAATLIAAADTPAAWGHAWHTPVNAPRTQREVISDMAAALGVPTPKVKSLSRPMLSVAGLFVPMIRELKETYYQFDEPFVLDDSHTREVLGLEPTGWSDIIADNLGLAARH